MSLTHDGEVDEMAGGGRGGDLTLVNALVPLLQVVDQQHPVLRARGVPGREPFVRGVGEATHRQQVDVSVPHPRHLSGDTHNNLLFNRRNVDQKQIHA